MNKKLLAIMACVCILLVSVCAIIACNNECEHNYVDGVCTKCNEPDPDYVQPKIDYDMSGVKFQDKSVVYNGQTQTITVTGTLPSGVTVEYKYYSDEACATEVSAAGVKNAGTYYVKAIFKGDDKHNKIDDMKATLTVTNADYDMSGVKFENKAVPFNGQTQTLAITGTLPKGVTVTYKYYSDAALSKEITDVKNAGTYYVVATFTGEQGYNKPADMKAMLTITSLELGDVTFADKTVEYNGEQQTLTLTGTLPEGLSVEYKYYSDEACTTEVAAANVKNAGTYYVNAIITDDKTDGSEVLKATLNVTKIDVTGITLGDVEFDYDGESKGIKIMGTLPEGVTVAYKFYSDKDCTTEVAAADVKNAGVYYAKAIFTVNGNYNKLNDKTAKIVIQKINVDDFKLENKSVVYNGSVQAYTAELELPNGITEVNYQYYSDANCVNKVESADVINAGTYYVTATFTVDGNHNEVRMQVVTLTVTKGAFTDLTEEDVELTVTATYEVTEDETTVTKTATATWDDVDKAYSFEFNAGIAYKVTVTATTDKSELTPTVQYFAQLNADGTLDGGSIANPQMQYLTDVKYATVTFADDNQQLVVLVKLEISKYTVNIRTYEDLLLMRDHIYGNTEKSIDPIPALNRTAMRYRLLNDIDCEGKIWTPVSYIMQDPSSKSFCSEFDGQGYTISNYRITEESFDAETVNTLAGNMLVVGFFGHVNSGVMYGGTTKSDADLDAEACHIHDVTFSNVTIKFDAKSENYKFNTSVAIYGGFVAGYINGGNWNTVGRTNLYNITVKNSVIDIDAYKQHIGGIVGYEDLGQSYPGVRKNLNVIDCAIYAISSKGTDNTNVYVGGLIGRIRGSVSETPDAEKTYWMRYNDCNIENIKIGFNYEGWLNADEDDKSGYLHVTGGNIYVGILFGYLAQHNLTFADCNVNGYELLTTGASSSIVWGLYGGKGGDVVLQNTSATQNEDWDNQYKGVYGFGAIENSASGLPEKIDETEIVKDSQGNDSPHVVWTSADAEPDFVTELLDKHEK